MSKAETVWLLLESHQFNNKGYTRVPSKVDQDILLPGVKAKMVPLLYRNQLDKQLNLISVWQLDGVLYS